MVELGKVFFEPHDEVLFLVDPIADLLVAEVAGLVAEGENVIVKGFEVLFKQTYLSVLLDC